MGNCPCCGQALPKKYKHLGLSASPSLLLEAVADAGEEGVKTQDLYRQLYGIRLDGGPDLKTLHVRIHYLNKRHLSRHGLRVVGERTGSGECGRYRLIRLAG